MDEKFLTPEEVAKLLGLHVESVRRLLRKGGIKGEKFGGSWRIRESDLIGKRKP